MGKTNKNNNQSKSNVSLPPAIKHKEEGNQYLKNQNYQKAIDSYTSAIKIDDQNPFYFNNRALAYYLIADYEKSLKDSEQAIVLDKQYIKAYIRKAQALRQLDNLEESIKVLQQVFSNFTEKDQVAPILKEFQQEFEIWNTVKGNEQDIQIFDYLVQKLQDSKTIIINNKIHFQPNNERGLRFIQDTKKDTEVIFVPYNQLISENYAGQNSEINKIIAEKNINLISKTHNKLALFLIEEKAKKSESKWAHFLMVLPTSYPSNPIFYNEQELQNLKGSPTEKMVLEKITDFKQDFDKINEIIPQNLKQVFTFEQYCWARLTVSSRQFGVEIKGTKTSVLVPYADMANHSNKSGVCDWNYADEKEGFSIKTTQNQNRSEELLYSYGRKANSRFLLNYGFTLPENEANDLPIQVQLEDIKIDPLVNKKKEFLKTDRNSIICKILQKYDEMQNIEFFGAMRFVCLSDEAVLDKLIKLHEQKEQNTGFNPIKTPPISAENETQMWNKINQLCIQLYSSYPQGLEEDYKLLKKKKELTQNQINCATICAGEKEIILAMLETSQKMLQLLKLSKKEILKLMVQPDFKLYVNYIAKVLLNTLDIRKE